MRIVWLLVAALLVANPARAEAPPLAGAPRAHPAAQKLLTTLLKTSALRGATIGVHVRDGSGATVIAHRPDAVMNPASGTKLLTTAAALDFYRPEHRFETRIVGRIDPDGKPLGPLTVVGGGDPRLMPEDIRALAKALVARGLASVDTIVVDGRLFGGDVPPAYDQKETAAGYRASVGAAASHFGAVWLTLSPGPSGGAAKVRLSPNVGAVIAVNNVVTAEGKTEVRTQVTALPDGRTKLVLDGNLGLDAKRFKERRRLAKPDALTGYLLRHALRKLKVGNAKGAKVVLAAADAPEPRGEVLAKHQSQPMVKLLTDVNVWSNNFMAETMFAMLSRATNPLGPTNWQDSQRNVSASLQRRGLDPQSFRIVNGSGLYNATHISPAAMTKLLAAVHADKRVWPVFDQTLAVSGSSGTLQGRLKGKLKGRFRGKTGTLDEVVSLSGYLTTKSGALLTVSLIVNDGHADRTGAYRAALDRFVKGLYRAL